MTQHYTSTAKFLHWLTALAVFGLLALGLVMTSLDLSPLMLKLYSWHKWIGISVLLVTVLRLIWRYTHPAPPLPETFPRLVRLAAHSGHTALYGLLIAMPLAGWIHSSAAGFPVVWFTVLPLPDPIGPNKAVSEFFSLLHWTGAWLLIGLLIVHIGAALWHHKVRQDDVLVRMLPGGKSMGAVIVAALLVGGPQHAEAGPADAWHVDTKASEITFSAKQMNVPMTGKFSAFVAAIVFDPASPESASIKLAIDAASIATGNVQADQALPGAEWFAVADHPTATFEAKGFKPTGKNTYEIAGTLTLKGHSEAVTVVASITTSPDAGDPQLLAAKASGEATVSRTAFRIGEGQWANTATIADEVIIGFSLKARREQ
ncbi:MAG: YceI family protein [Aestuariivirgaceae bacterium]